MGKSNFVFRAGLDATGVEQGAKKAEDAIKGLGDHITAAFTKAALIVEGFEMALHALERVGEYMKEATQEAAKYQAQVAELNRIFEGSAQSFTDWANTTGRAFGYSRAEAAKTAVQLSQLTMSFATDAKQNSEITKQLMQDIAITASKTGHSIDEVAEGFRSGLAGQTKSIEQYGIMVQERVLMSTNAYKKMEEETGKTFKQMTYQQQAAVRVAAIHEQVLQKMGDEVSNNVNYKMQKFSNTLSDIKLGLGQAFLPILNRVLPILDVLAQKLLWLVNIIAQFTAALFGSASMSAGSAASLNQEAEAHDNLAQAADKSTNALNKHKQAKGKGTASFDQVHTLSSNKGGAGAGADGGAGSGAGGYMPEKSLLGDVKSSSTPSAAIQAFADKVKEVAKAVEDAGKTIEQAWDGCVKFFLEHKELILVALASIGTALLIVFGTGPIVEFLAMIPAMLAAFGEVIAATWAWAAANIAATWEIVLLVAIIALVVAGVIELVLHWKEVKQWALDVWKAIVDKWQEFEAWWKKNVTDPFKKGWDEAWTDLKKGAQDTWTEVCKAWADVEKWWNTNVWTPITKVWHTISTDVAKIAGDVWTGVCTAWNGVEQWFKDNVWTPITKVWNTISTDVQKIASDIWTGITTFITDVFSGDWQKAWGGISTIFSNVFTGLLDLAKAPLNAIIDLINKVIGGLNSVQVPSWVPGLGGKSLSLPTIPHLANGGITNGTTMAMIGDNWGGQEVVSPLDKLTGIVTNAVLQALSFSNHGSKQQSTGDIILNIDGRQFARVVKPYMDDENKRSGGTNVMLNRI